MHYLAHELAEKEKNQYHKKLVIFQIPEPISGLSSFDFKKGGISEAIDTAFHRGLEILEDIY